MIEVLNIQATNKKDGRIINYKEIRMIQEIGKMRLVTHPADTKIVAVYSYDHAILYKNKSSIGICLEHITTKRSTKHYLQGIETLYQDYNERLYNKILVAYYEVRKFCETTKHDVEYINELLSFIDGIGLGSYQDGGKEWLKITHKTHGNA